MSQAMYVISFYNKVFGSNTYFQVLFTLDFDS